MRFQERDSNDAIPQVNYTDPNLQKALAFVGGIDTLIIETKKGISERKEFIERQAGSLALRMAKDITPEEANLALLAFHGSSRLLAQDYIKANQTACIVESEKIDVLHATNVLDTALCFVAEGSEKLKVVQEYLKKMQKLP